MKAGPGNDGAFTILEAIIVLVIVILLFAGLSVAWGAMQARAPSNPQDIVTSALDVTGGTLTLRSPVTGFNAVDGTMGTARYHFPQPDSGKLGAVQVTVSLLVGDMGGIDMDKATVTLITKTVSGTISEVKPGTGTVNAPGWTITRKSNWLPGQQADADNILEPNEQFDLLILSPTPLPSYTSFTVAVQPSSGVPLSFSRTVPIRITPVMDLG